MALRSLALPLLVAFASGGCGEPRESRSEVGSQPATQDEAIPKRYRGIELAKVQDGIVRVDAIMGRSPDEVAGILGEPSSFSEQPVSCVRLLPDRVFFSCKHEFAVYAAPEGAAEQIELEFEDGKATVLAVAGLVGEGPFDAERALELVGLELPGKPMLKHPEFQDRMAQKTQNTVDLHSWWNGEARLILGGKEHRVEVSVVNGEWRRSKVKVVENHPLDADQQARVIKKAPPDGAPASEDASEAAMPE
jgi:hypothetical protein